MNAATLIDDQGTPARWKVATLISAVALIVTLVLSIAKAGAKSEKLETVARRVSALEALAPKVERLDAWKESVNLQLGEIKVTLKEIQMDQRELLKRRGR